MRTPEQFDFSKEKDQKKFESLPQEEQKEIIDMHHEDALLIEKQKELKILRDRLAEIRKRSGFGGISKGGQNYNEFREISNKIKELQQEIEKMLPIFIVYRENDLFNKNIPEMMEILHKLGHKVYKHSFPKGTEREEIEKWYEENEKKNKKCKNFFRLYC